MVGYQSDGQIRVRKGMRGYRRAFHSLWIVLLVLVLAPLPVSAEQNPARLLEADVIASIQIPESSAEYSLAIQATSLLGTPHRYTLTVMNLTPWTIPSLTVFDRYLPENPEQPEIQSSWFLDPLEPDQAATVVLTFPDGPLPDACHQLEISLADGLGFVLMDCSRPNATTFWNVPTSPEIETFLERPLLTAERPEGASRLGIHVTRNSDPGIMAFVREAQPAVIVGVGDLGWLSEVKETSPQTVTVGRFAETDQHITGDPVERARAFVAEHLERYQANPGVDYWLGWNEPVIDEVWQMQWYATFEAERVRAMAELGYKSAIGNFSTGTPEAHEFAAFLEAVRAAKDHGGILALHEYSAPTMKHGVGAGIPGHDAKSSAGSLTLRYRYFYDYYLRVHDLIIPLVFTEAGIDGGVLRQGGLGGWRDFDPIPYEWVDGATTHIPYMDQINWYDDELRRDPYVLGFAIFNVGETTGMWASFDVTDMLSEFAALIATKVPR
jgi:hypothetical protein